MVNCVRFIAIGVMGIVITRVNRFHRVLSLVALAAVAAGIALTTQKGVAFREMLKEARIELRKAFGRRERVGQTTAIVVVVVLIVALILWALDSLFA